MFGLGTGTFTEWVARLPGRPAPIEPIHNVPLLVVAETGVVGLSAWLALGAAIAPRLEGMAEAGDLGSSLDRRTGRCTGGRYGGSLLVDYGADAYDVRYRSGTVRWAAPTSAQTRRLRSSLPCHWCSQREHVAGCGPTPTGIVRDHRATYFALRRGYFRPYVTPTSA